MLSANARSYKEYDDSRMILKISEKRTRRELSIIICYRLLCGQNAIVILRREKDEEEELRRKCGKSEAATVSFHTASGYTSSSSNSLAQSNSGSTIDWQYTITSMIESSIQTRYCKCLLKYSADSCS